ncbi:hypothetical protein DFH09DRAFT_1103070 [Mycena vulgaris]|nr:hypothetical protein DFH09DRAFT_1103070 [Mycena vulgaris]
MVAIEAPRLNETEEAAVRALHKSVRAPRYEDPIDQDAFLVAAARSILLFREQVASFALAAELGECVFAIRAQMQVNNTRITTPPDEAFSTISDFASEIARTRTFLRERKRTQTVHLRAEEGAAARAERREALQRAAMLKSRKLRSPHEDTVSIPSDSETENMPAAPAIETSPVTAPAVSTTVASPAPGKHGSSLCTPWLYLPHTPPPIARVGALIYDFSHNDSKSIGAAALTVDTAVPTGPRADRHLPIQRPPHKRARSETEEEHMSVFHRVPSPAPTPCSHHLCIPHSHPYSFNTLGEHPGVIPAAYPSSQHRSVNSSADQVRPPSEPQLRRRLAALEAEVHRLSCAQKRLAWQVQELQDSPGFSHTNQGPRT